MKFLQWLNKKEIVKIPKRENTSKKKVKSTKKSTLVTKIYEVENGVIDIASIEIVAPLKKFIHEETGKEYKTASALKAGMTRYKKKNAGNVCGIVTYAGDEVAKMRKDETKKFIDEKTGKKYKTASALKAGITRRLKKQKCSEEL